MRAIGKIKGRNAYEHCQFRVERLASAGRGWLVTPPADASAELEAFETADLRTAKTEIRHLVAKNGMESDGRKTQKNRDIHSKIMRKRMAGPEGEALRRNLTSPETRAKMSASAKARYAAWTEEEREAWSKQRRGRKLTPETRAKISAAKIRAAKAKREQRDTVDGET